MLSTDVERRLEALLPQLMADEPVVVLSGPRTVGKSTVLRQLARRLDVTVLDLDDVGTRNLVAADLNTFVGGPSPVLIDEFQHVPTLLDTIKAELNRDTRPGRFVLTGSTRYETMPRTAQSLTGRVHVVTVWPMSQGEIAGHRETFVARLLAEFAAVAGPAPDATTREEYVERILAGGLPAALRRNPGRPRERWYDDYVRLVVERDVLDIKGIRQSAKLPTLLARLASQTGQMLNVAHAARETGLTPSVAEDYTRLLESVFLVHRLPAWGTTLAARATKAPKVHLVDTGLGAFLMRLTADSLQRRVPAVLAEFGHLAETFVVNEVLKQLSWLDVLVQVGHYRTSDGDEVDLVLETAAGDVIAIAVKAGSTFRREDVRGLRHLRNRLGGRFRGGVLLSTNPMSATVDDRITVAPIALLWGPPPG